MSEYAQFLATKDLRAKSVGKPAGEPHPSLFPFQRDVTRWAVQKGRAAIFLNMGLGKTRIQVEWARLIGEPTLIIAPLAVCPQTVAEAAQIGVTVQYVATPSAITTPISITNYERAHLFDAMQFNAVVLDESSILKHLDSKMRLALTAQWKNTPYRLALTATPAPNELKEIVNHADFLGVMSRKEVFASFFINETGKDGGLKTRLKDHAVQPFYEWLSSWAMAARRPSDLGYSDEGYLLPPLTVERHSIPTDYRPSDQLFFTKLKGVTDRSKVQRETMNPRLVKAIELANADTDQYIMWHLRNDEGYALQAAVQGGVLVEGAMSAEEKAAAFAGFADGTHRVLITKPSIAGFGMNFQYCHKAIFCSLDDSYEGLFQAMGRVHRFGQQHPVSVHIIHADVQEGVWENIQAKQKEAELMLEQLITQTQAGNQAELQAVARQETYVTAEAQGQDWRLLLGDSCERLKELASDSVGLSVFSPPFVARYAYSASHRDLGNSGNLTEFMRHFRFIAKELLRVTMPGRNVCVHVQQVRLTKRDTGNISLIDFRGLTIRLFQRLGFIYKTEFTVDKDAQIQAKRKYHQYLMYKTMETDATKSGAALGDYLLVFQKQGENPTPVLAEMSRMQWNTVARPVWQDNITDLKSHYRASQPPKLASLSKDDLIALCASLLPAWYDIQEVAVIKSQVDNDDDNAHLCPLQLPFIERCLRLYSNPNDLILDPFNGVGSTGHEAVRLGRRYVGIELNPAYFNTAVANLTEAERLKSQQTLFDYAGLTV